jgi:NAD(P)-dependent dehydrogenase (short-subunit alcohol dehydrogenase family)
MWTFLIVVGLIVGLYFWFTRDTGVPQKLEGCVLITGADSGMGEAAAVHLADKGMHVFAGIFLEKSEALYAGMMNVTTMKLDVSKQDSIDACVKKIRAMTGSTGGNSNLRTGLVSLINCAGLGFTGPAEYFPMEQFRRQLDVNFYGYVATTQAVLPLIKEAVKNRPDRRGRVMFVGTGGGVPSPSPALLSAYMASKWATEAFCQSLRLEMRLVKQPVDVLMINPGFIKPTGLMSVGKELLERTWALMPPQAREEYGGFVDAFTKFSEEQKGTHPRFVALAMETALRAGNPLLRYRVGVDSKVSPIVGLLPTGLRETMLSKAMYGVK